MRAAVDEFCEHGQLIDPAVLCPDCRAGHTDTLDASDACEVDGDPSEAATERQSAEGSASDKPDVLAGLRDGLWLDRYRPPPMRWAVPGLVPEGLSLLAGAPKRGKSWLALDLCLAVASGGLALGSLPVEQGSALYLALEDGPRRLRDRVQLLNGAGSTPREFRFITTLEGRLSEVLVAYLDQFCDTRLVVLDTLGRVRPPGRTNGDRYAEDYRQMAWLQSFALSRGIALLVVHHTRKAASDDFVDEVSGTHGLAGAADAVMVLKRPRGEADGLLQVTGRDIEERDVYLRRSGPAWQVFEGMPADANYSPAMAAVLAAVAERPDGIGPKEVAQTTGLDDALVRQYLRRAEGRGDVRKASWGRYVPVTTVTSVPLPVASPPGRDTGDEGDRT